MPPIEIIRGADNAPLTPLLGRTVAVIGFGNQGHAHALNLRDSGVNVIVGNRADSETSRHAAQQGFQPRPIEEAATEADLVILAIPDEAQPEMYRRQIAPHLKPGAIVGFLHGFSIHYKLIKPTSEVGVVMIAPKGPGKTLRDRFVEGRGIPCLYALHQDSPDGNAKDIALAWAAGIGCARAGIICTSFADETITDLFGEQAVLCGGMTSLILAAFETLASAGYPPELAYLECCHEVKQIADLVYERGLAGMMESISNTAEFGAYQSGPSLVDEHVREKLGEVLDQVRSDGFAQALRRDYERGFPWFSEQRRKLAEHPIESAGAVIRSLMPHSPPSE